MVLRLRIGTTWLITESIGGISYQKNLNCIVACTPIARQRIGKQVPAKTDS
jgi:hypothetical protein